MNQLQNMTAELGERLKQSGQTVAVAESTAGGLISSALLSVAGASAYYRGGTVIYTRDSRKIFLDLDLRRLKDLEPLSEPMAAFFAEAIKETLGATWGIAELGAAGPSGSAYGHPPGTSVIAVAGPVQLSKTIRTGSDNREENMWAFAQAALDLMKEASLKG